MSVGITKLDKVAPAHACHAIRLRPRAHRSSTAEMEYGLQGQAMRGAGLVCDQHLLFFTCATGKVVPTAVPVLRVGLLPRPVLLDSGNRC
jgi:hypothetical protein